MKIVLDIETIPTPVEDWFVEMKREQLAQEYKKEETIQKHLDDSIAVWWKEWGGSKPVAIAMKNLLNQELWGAANPDPDQLVSDWIAKLSEWTFPSSPIKFVGFNVTGFDLLNLHIVLAKRKEQLPILKLGRYDIIDLADVPYGFKVDRKGKTLNYYLRAFGIEAKTTIGSEVLKLWEADLQDGGTRTLDYCKSDVERTAMLLDKLSLIWSI